MWGWHSLIPKTVIGAAWRIALAAMLLIVTDAFWLEPASLRVTQADVPVRGMPVMRIAVIADLHAGAPYIDTAKIKNIVHLTNDAKPDLILLAGDYVVRGVIGKHYMPIESIAPLLKPLHAPLGVYAVIGNHDRWDDAGRITAVLEKTGIAVLENRSTVLRFKGRTIYLAGIGDYNTGADNPALALAGIPAGQSAICLTHSPDIFPELPDACALTIAGHTHGGQVWLPLAGRLIVPSEYGEKFAAGLAVIGNKTLFVSTGIGTSGLPVRFFVPPEISLLEVHDNDGK
jgi:uncharacterized protein